MNIIAAVALIRELEFTIHPEKPVLVSTQEIIFLRFVIDFVKMTITLLRKGNNTFTRFTRISFQITMH